LLFPELRIVDLSCSIISPVTHQSQSRANQADRLTRLLVKPVGLNTLAFVYREPVKPQSHLPLEQRGLSGSYTNSSVPGPVNNRLFIDRQQRPEPEVDCNSTGRTDPQRDAGVHDAVQ